MPDRLIVAITGASGSIYGYSLVRTIVSLGWSVELVITPMGQKVMAYECGFNEIDYGKAVRLHAIDNLFSPLASGSFQTKGMVVIPCSMNTLGLMANGTGDNLLARAAQVTMKEGRKLVVVPREMPYSIIFLENMLRLARAGAAIVPASPGFYHQPKSIDDLVNHVVGRVLDQFNIEHNLFKRWEGKVEE